MNKDFFKFFFSPMKVFTFICLALCSSLLSLSCSGDGFNSVIQNEIENKYSPSPGNNGIISAVYWAPGKLEIKWQPASDDVTAVDALQYRVFTSAAVFSGYDDALLDAYECTSGWSVGIDHVQADTEDGFIWCNVFVRDSDGNISPYSGAVPAGAGDLSPIIVHAQLAAVSVTASSYTLSWESASDDYTPAENLEYRVFRSQDSALDTLDNARINGEEVTISWTKNITSAAVSIPLLNRNWYFKVFVCDSGGNISAYDTLSLYISQSNAPVPGNSGAVSAVRSGNANNVFTLYWEKGSDDLTEQRMLLYKVYRSSNRNYVLNYADASAYAEARTIGWTADLNSLTETVVFSGTNAVYYNVFICDDEGGISSYTPCTASITSTGTNPVAGGSGIVTAETKAAKKIQLAWAAASDGETQSDSLQYAVYYSDAVGEVSSYESALQNGTLSMSWTSAVTAYEAKMPDKGITYYLNVFVMDGDGNVSSYTEVSAVSGN